MPNTKLTRARLANHLRYGKWVYLIIALAGFFVADLLFQMTRYVPPAERRIDIELVQPGFVDTDALQDVEAAVLAAAQGFDASLEVVEFVQLSYSGDPAEDVYGAQAAGVRLGAREGAIWVMPRVLFESLHQQGALLALDGYVEDGVIVVGDADLAGYRLPGPSEETDEAGAPLAPDGPTGLYGLPGAWLDVLGLAGFETEDTVAAIMGYSVNPDTAARVLAAIMTHPLAPKTPA